MFKENKNSYLFPAGNYWIGDPCYCFPHEGPFENKWGEFLTALISQDSGLVELDLGKITVWANGTEYGDGLYISESRHDFSVDSGLLGIVSRETIDYLNLYEGDLTELEQLGLFKEFKEDFIVSKEDGGFFFGDEFIPTK